MNRRRDAILASTTLCLAFGGCRARREAPPPPPSVMVTPVLQRDVPILEEWIGTTDGDVNAQIRPRVDGYLLRRLYQEGGAVRKGDVLFEIDPRQVQASVQQAQASLEQAEAALAKADHDVDRAAPLAAEKALSQQELDNALSAQRSARGAVEAGRATLEQARLNLDWARVTSPIAGIAGIAAAQVGDLVTPQTILTTVSTVDPIRVAFKVSEQDYLRFAGGPDPQGVPAPRVGELDLLLADGTVFPHRGRLIVESREVDARTGTLTMLGIFPNPGNILRPGQYAKVRAQTQVKKGALLVPQRALNELQGTFQVAVVGPDNKAEIRAVRAAERVGDLWVIDDGVKAGERVVVEGFSRAKAGAVVDPKERPAASAGDAPAGK
jgi:membrane fusion protein, multidrug efflux system